MDLMGLVPDLGPNDDTPKPVVKHECRFLPKEDPVNSFIKQKSPFTPLNRWLMRKRIVCPRHYYTQTCLKSTTTIRYEITKHLQDFPYMIHPFSPARNFWNAFMMPFTLAVLFLAPYLSTFFFNDHMKRFPYFMTIDFVMLLDIIFNFFTGYYDQCTKVVNLDPRVVFTKYVKGYFIMDFLSAVPVEIVNFLIELRNNQHDYWFCTTFSFIKIFRIRNVIHNLHQFQKSYHLSFNTIKIMEIALIIIIGLHWSACLVYFIPLLVVRLGGQGTDHNKSWINSDSMKKRDTRVKKYILSLNRATISLVSSAHYLDVVTAEDMIMNFILSVLGQVGFVYLLAQFLQLMTTSQYSNKERLRLLQQLHEYMQYKELPRVTQNRLLVYCSYWHKNNFNRDGRILAQVSEPLREVLILHNYKRLLETVDFFAYLPQQAIVKLVKYIKPEIYLSNDVIVKADTQGDSLYFVSSGTVAVYTSIGKEICHLEDGSYFGEISLVIDNEERVATIIAIETCQILAVPRDAFQHVIAPYPNLLNRLQKVALERLDKSMLLDEIYNLEESDPHYINISNITRKKKE